MKSTRFSIGPRSRSGRPRGATPDDAGGFELLGDREGTVVFGWATRAVLYTRFEGGLSAQIGSTYAMRLGALVARAQSVAYFCDSSTLKHYDLLARSAFVRVVLAHRRRFTSIVMLTWAEGISQATRTLVETLGDPIEILTDSDAFEAQLLRAAPTARRKLDPTTWVHTTPPVSTVR